MKHGSLFSGIGGFDLAAEIVGWNNVFQVEKDDWCRRVLSKNFKTIQYSDIYEFDGTKYRGDIDVISGGFPCQPFSQAGSKKGTRDNRYLWPEMLRVIGEIQPRYIVGENVSGLVNWNNGEVALQIQEDLANKGYKTSFVFIPAISIGAWHYRERLWIIAYASEDFNGTGKAYKGQYSQKVPGNNISPDQLSVANNVSEATFQFASQFAENDGLDAFNLSDAWQTDWIHVASDFCRDRDGISVKLDANSRKRIEHLGNAIVPQIAVSIFRTINSFDTFKKTA